MRTVRTNQSGQLLSSEVQDFGGAFSLFKKLKYKGVGSPRVTYYRGIEAFDAIGRGIEGEISFVSFELLKNGLLLRFNQNQRTACLGVKLSDIRAINLTAFRIKLVVKKKFQATDTKIVHRGVLEICEKEGSKTSFNVIAREFTDIKSFFEKPVFTEQFNYELSDAEPEKDYSHFLNFLGKI